MGNGPKEEGLNLGVNVLYGKKGSSKMKQPISCPLLVCLWIGTSSPESCGLLVVYGDPQEACILYFLADHGLHIIPVHVAFLLLSCLIWLHVWSCLLVYTLITSAYTIFFAEEMNTTRKPLILWRFPFLISRADINMRIWVHFKTKGWASLYGVTLSLPGANYASDSQRIHDQAYTKCLEQTTAACWRKGKRK